MSATRTLASYLSKLKYEDLPPEVAEKGKLCILDALGNCIGGYALKLSKTFLELSKDLGGGIDEASLIGDGTKVSVSMAAFGNGALTTALDYSDYVHSQTGRIPLWLGAMAVPATLAAAESRNISGKELIASVVAGYECSARVLDSMDYTEEASQIVNGETISVFAAAGGAGRALGLDEDQMFSNLGMTGIYTPVPALLKWSRDEGLNPRKDIKQGWAWMCMTGAFAAVSAQKGFNMLQPNGILDGDKGLWRMLGMDIHREELLTAGLGETFHTLKFHTKIVPGCAATHTAAVGAMALAKEHNIDAGDIEKIDVVTNKSGAVGFGNQSPVTEVEREFSVPYQVSAALLAGDKGPNWYLDKTANRPEVASLVKRVNMGYDDDCEKVWLETRFRMSKISLTTKSGQRFSTEVKSPGQGRTREQITNKFVTTTSQVIDKSHVEKLRSTIENLDQVERVSELVDLLRFPAQA